jgi:hypothetical protein
VATLAEAAGFSKLPRVKKLKVVIIGCGIGGATTAAAS